MDVVLVIDVSNLNLEQSLQIFMWSKTDVSAGNKKPEGGELDAPGEEKMIRSGDTPDMEEHSIVEPGESRRHEVQFPAHIGRLDLSKIVH